MAVRGGSIRSADEAPAFTQEEACGLLTRVVLPRMESSGFRTAREILRGHCHRRH